MSLRFTFVTAEFKSSPQIYRERGCVICGVMCVESVWSTCRRLKQWWLVLLLLGVDTTLVEGCGIRKLAQFQGSEMRTRGHSKISSFGFVFGVNQKN